MSFKFRTTFTVVSTFSMALLLSSPVQASAIKKIEDWATCVGDKGPDKCKSQKKAACKAAYDIAFTKGYSPASEISKWNKAGKPKRWKQATANLGFKNAGLGPHFCYNLRG